MMACAHSQHWLQKMTTNEFALGSKNVSMLQWCFLVKKFIAQLNDQINNVSGTSFTEIQAASFVQSKNSMSASS